MKPYVVSSDLMTLWRRAGVVLPKDALEQFRYGIRNSLKRIHASCDWIGERELIDGIQHLLAGSSAPIVSLDEAYAPDGKDCIGVSRLHSGTGEDFGYGSRGGESKALDPQISDIAQAIGGKEVALVDDVVFSGSLCARVIELFQEHGVRVRNIYVGVAIEKGIARLQSLGCAVQAVRVYKDVVDEVCERDFMPGAPLSGRTVAGLPNTGMPYLHPYGRPTQWASIPAIHADQFSATCLLLAANIYRQICMKPGDLPRNIHGLNCGANTLLHEHLIDTAISLQFVRRQDWLGGPVAWCFH